MAETIRKALGGKTELWRAPGAGHTGFDSPEYRYTRQFAVKMHEFFKSLGDDLAYEAYFNEDESYYAGSLFGPVQNPAASARYASLF